VRVYFTVFWLSIDMTGSE